jgi:hypothetical protein
MWISGALSARTAPAEVAVAGRWRNAAFAGCDLRRFYGLKSNGDPNGIRNLAIGFVFVRDFNHKYVANCAL